MVPHRAPPTVPHRCAGHRTRPAGCGTGFSLIELMIVLAIVAILAAQAMPAYQDYAAKAQAGEGPVIVDGLKTPLMEQVGQLGDAGCALPSGGVTIGRYVSGVTVGGTATACKIEVTYAATANSKVSGRKYSQTYNVSATASPWTCTTNLPADIAPKSC